MMSRVAMAALLIGSMACTRAIGQQVLTPGTMPRIGEVDARFQSYNIEMVTVTGGRFWRSYAGDGRPDSELFSQRPPIDLANPRLRKLAAALGTAYLRVSGTWANATYFANSDRGLSAPPTGYDSVLTRDQWRGVIDFAAAVNAQIMTSFAVSRGSRDAKGMWKPDQAKQLVAYTHALGAHIAAAELMNEPDLTPQNAAPPGYGATAYGRDIRTFAAFMRHVSPQTLIVGPGSIGDDESASSGLAPGKLLAASGSNLDIVSYHHYNTLSARCGGHDDPAQALTDAWFARTGKALAVYKTLRDQYAPGKPIWLTETADAACGGNKWDATFLDSFRYLDQLGRLAKAGVDVVMHNTLAGSDYGLLDERGFAPRPNYWAALLWHRLMGTTVLDAGAPARSGLHIYAHCDPSKSGGVTLLAINSSADQRSITLPLAVTRFTLQAPDLQSGTVRLNGNILALGDGDTMPYMTGQASAAGALTLAPLSISFLAIPDASNPACH